MQKILITGARSGMVYPVIQKLKKDYKVYVSVHTDSELKYIKKLYRNDRDIECLKLDITKDEDKLVSLNIDVLVCNAAIAESGSLFEIPLNKVRENFEVNVLSNLKLIQIASKQMLLKGGRIVVISSLTSKSPLPFLGSYCASKAALSSLARTMHYESMFLPGKLDIVLVEPGLYRTGFNKLAFDKKYEFMDIETYFDKHIDLIRKVENVYLYLFEKRRLDSIAFKIYQAITAENPRFRYSAPFSHNLFSKIINLFY